MKYCTSCGAENRETARFCARCGTRSETSATVGAEVRLDVQVGETVTSRAAASSGKPTLSEIVFTCPSCSKSLAVSEVAAGKTCACTDCGSSITVPTPVIRFTCGHCNHGLSAPADLIGSLVNCPECQSDIVVPEANAHGQDEFRFSCPFCDQHFLVPQTMAGSQTVCPSCRKAIDVPQPAPVSNSLSLPSRPQTAIQASDKSGVAICSLMLGILSLVTCFVGPLFGVPAAICGYVARGKIKQSHGQLKGAGLALSGLIMGYVAIGAFVILVLSQKYGVVDLNRLKHSTSIRDALRASSAEQKERHGDASDQGDLGGRGSKGAGVLKSDAEAVRRPLKAVAQSLADTRNNHGASRLAGYSPTNVVLDFLAAAAKSDTVKAMSFLGEGFKADMVGECKAKAASGWTYSASYTKITSTTADAGNSTVIVDMVFDGGGTFMATPRTFSLCMGKDGWKIIGIEPPPTSQETGVSPL